MLIKIYTLSWDGDDGCDCELYSTRAARNKALREAIESYSNGTKHLTDEAFHAEWQAGNLECEANLQCGSHVVNALAFEQIEAPFVATTVIEPGDVYENNLQSRMAVCDGV